MSNPVTASGPGGIAVGGSVFGSTLITGRGNIIFVNAAQFLQRPEARNYLRLLAVLTAPIANSAGDGPPDGPPLDVWGEWERLRQAVGGHDPVSGAGAPWAVVRLSPPTAEALSDALAVRDTRYQVIHFSGHGTPTGLILEDDLGREQFVTTEELVTALRRDAGPPAAQLVVLNACDTATVADALHTQARIPAVIATQQPITDQEAQVLSERLYRRLAAGATVGEALDEARRTLISRYQAGELGLEDDPQARADNLILVGDPNLRLALDGPAASQPLFVLHPTPHNDPLPMATLRGFVGRYSELLTLAHWFEQTDRLAFAISGVGGIGKTALALNAALRYGHRFTALAFASAKGNADFGPQEVIQALNAALDLTLSEEEAKNLPGAIARRLNNQAVLLVLDNLESLSARQSQELARALAGVDPHNGSRVLLTLRPQEKDPLTALAGGDRLTLSRLDPASALRLAWEEVARQRCFSLLGPWLTTTLSPRDQVALDNLRQRAWLEDVPLPLVAFLDHLADLSSRHPAILKLAITMLRRHNWPGTQRRLQAMQGKELETALEEMIGQMVNDLQAQSPEALAVLQAAVLFRGGSDVTRLRYVVLGREIAEDSREAIDFEDHRLLPAVDANLLVRDQDRYDLEPPVRAYLERRCQPDAAILADYRRRHAKVHLPIVATYDDAIKLGVMTYSAPLAWADVTAAWDWLSSVVPEDEAAARLLVEYAQHWRNVVYNNHDPRREGWLAAAWRAAARVGNPQEQANVLQAQGDVLYFLKRTDEALAKYNDALGLFRQVGDRLGEANVLKAQGDVLAFLDRRDEALAKYNDALGLFRQVGARLGEANVLKAQGDVLYFLKRTDEALAKYNDALGLFRQVGDRLGEANTLLSLGDLRRGQCDYESAKTVYVQALQLYTLIDDRYSLARVFYRLGDWHAEQQQRQEAAQMYREAIALWQSIGMDDLVSQILLPKLKGVE